MSDRIVNVKVGRPIYYQSVVRGVTEQLTGKDTVYYGKVFRVNRDDFTGPKHIALEEAMLKEINGNEWTPQGSIFPDDAALERYEVFEPGTDDVLVMYRMPAQEAEETEIPLPPIEAGGVRVMVVDEEKMSELPPPNEFFKLYGYYLALVENGRLDEAQEFVKELAALADVVAAKYGMRCTGGVPSLALH